LPDTLLAADYAALEVVILADLCKRLFNDGQLESMVAPGAPDIHVANARGVFGEYLGWRVPEFATVEGKRVACSRAGQRADDIPAEEFRAHPYGALLRGMVKTVWYGLMYCKGAYGFSVLPGPDGEPIGESVAQRMLDGIEAAVPGPFRWQAWVRDYVDEHRGIYSLGGRWCDLSGETDDSAPDWLRNRAYRRATNFPMQATGAEIISNAMTGLERSAEWAGSGFRVCLQVHDELVARGPLENVECATKLLSEHMTRATANGTPLLVPLRVSTGHGINYFEAK
jgi:DNA polymerase I-like protein with 3'-5' exonuclease and polymerase domains